MLSVSLLCLCRNVQETLKSREGCPCQMYGIQSTCLEVEMKVKMENVPYLVTGVSFKLVIFAG